MKATTFREFLELSERFVNLIGSDERKEIYQVEVWNILQDQYQSIGGIRGSGFNTIQDMIDNIPFWKLVTKDGTIHAVVMYKDKGGRKSVQMGVLKNSGYGRDKVVEILRNDVRRQYTERSKSALGLTMKSTPWNILKEFIITFNNVKKRYPNAIQASSVKFSDLPQDAQNTLKRFPELIPYGYLREIGNEYVFKVMLGTPDLGIH